MNFVYLSPHFPPNYYLFCQALHRNGVRVLGVGEEPYDNLRPELREALTEYYRVENMEDYGQVHAALQHHQDHHGAIDFVESLNEHWLYLEGRLRDAFNVPGRSAAETATIRKKSRMKETYRTAGIPVARGRLVTDQEDARAFIDEVGYPIIIKPDEGVGAIGTTKVNSADDLDRFFRHRPEGVPFIMEEFISGVIHSYDGIVDAEGTVIYENAFVYSSGVMDVVNFDEDVYYYNLRDIPTDLQNLGRSTVDAFNVRARFFHFEFFRTESGGFIAIEVNVRPPGGFSVDMFNYSQDRDLFQTYADMIVGKAVEPFPTPPYIVGYSSRKAHLPYAHRHDEIMERHGDAIALDTSIPQVFRGAMGDYGYIYRSRDKARFEEIVRFIHSRA